MKIAFISYEYPPDTASGGIDTYLHQTASILKERGHHVEVFAASTTHSGSETETSGVIVHRVPLSLSMRPHFFQKIAEPFHRRHQAVHFDVLEGPERFSDAAGAIALVPDMPLVVRLDGPEFLRKKLRTGGEVDALDTAIVELPTIKHLLRFSPRGLLALRLVDDERRHALAADAMVSPSAALMGLVASFWKLDSRRISCIPPSFVIPPELMSIPVDVSTDRVTFFGRLETLQGVLDLARAIPEILASRPQTRFRFVGATRESPDPELTMRQYLQAWLAPYGDAVEFTGKVLPDRLASLLADTDVCVSPSLWDNFPMALIAAMAAGRAVVGSVAGGGREIVCDAKVGRLVAPGRPDQIAQCVLQLLDSPDLRQELGAAARDRVLTHYAQDRIALMREQNYEQAIRRRKDMGPRAGRTIQGD